MRFSKKACAALVAFLILAAPAVACSQKGGTEGQQADSAARTSGSGSSGRTVIVGKVTAVVGNQVTLAVGNLNRSGGGSSGFGFRRQSSGASSSPAPASSGASAEVSSGTSSSASSSLITLTGETKTVLIPVGLTLSNGYAAGSRAGGTRSGASGSGGGMARSGGGQQASGSRAAGGFGGTGGTGGTVSRASGSGGTAGGTAGAGTLTQRSSDFSSITTGMILQIVEETLSDGTQGIVSVSVLSR